LIAIDTNILVYSLAASTADPRHIQAMSIMRRATLASSMLPLQVLGEFLNVCRVKLKLAPPEAVQQVSDYLALYFCPPTASGDLIVAADLTHRFSLQFFDALIIAVAIRHGAKLLLSEDMQDGLVIDGLTIVNPFVAANEGVLADWLDRR
jgi:predicted nucleic acid-binding protein